MFPSIRDLLKIRQVLRLIVANRGSHLKHCVGLRLGNLNETTDRPSVRPTGVAHSRCFRRFHQESDAKAR